MMDEIIGAVYRADLEALSRLLNSESVAWVDADGRTALMHALLADDVSPSVVEFLLRAGVPPDVHDTAGQAWTALHFAARRQRPDLVKLLLQNGAPVDALDSFGNTPLWRAVMSTKDDFDTVQALLRGGANPMVANKAGVSPLNLAERAGKVELSQVLTSHSSKP